MEVYIEGGVGHPFDYAVRSLQIVLQVVAFCGLTHSARSRSGPGATPFRQGSSRTPSPPPSAGTPPPPQGNEAKPVPGVFWLAPGRSAPRLLRVCTPLTARPSVR